MHSRSHREMSGRDIGGSKTRSAHMPRDTGARKAHESLVALMDAWICFTTFLIPIIAPMKAAATYVDTRELIQ